MESLTINMAVCRPVYSFIGTQLVSTYSLNWINICDFHWCDLETPSVIDILAHTLENGVSSSIGIDSPENLPNFSPTKHLYLQIIN